LTLEGATLGRRTVVLSTGGICTLLGVLVLIGWIYDIPALIRLEPASNPMVANAAVGFVLSGLALILISAQRPRAASACAVWSLATGALTLAEYGLSTDLGFDQILLADRINASGHPGRLAPNTALAFILCGCALLSAAWPRSSNKSVAITGISGAGVTALVAASFWGYLAGYPTYAWGPWTHMASNAALGFIVLGIGIVSTASLDGQPILPFHELWPGFAVGCRWP
jgi:hypothetical protein